MSLRIRRMVLIAIVIAIFLFLYSSCRKVEYNPPVASGSLKIGVWILDLQQYCNRYDGPENVADLLAKHGISYAVPKTHSAYYHRILTSDWYPTCPEALFRQFANACHKRGIKVYAWVYVYGGVAANNDINLSTLALRSNSDGLVLNAESEYCRDIGRYDDAENLCKSVRQLRDSEFPNKLLAYSSFARAWKGIGLRFPYRIFGEYCDQFWPQTYWRTFGCSPEAAIESVDEHFQAKYDRWQTNPRQAVGIKLIVHTGHVYAKTIPPNEVRRFLTTATSHGHGEVNLYIADRFSLKQWGVIDEFTSRKIGQASVDQHSGFVEAVMWVIKALLWAIATIVKVYIFIGLGFGLTRFIVNPKWPLANRVSRSLRLVPWWLPELLRAISR